jgi:hypothetical protein
MPKTAIISWRIKPELRRALESEAGRLGMTLGEMLSCMIKQWLEARKQTRLDDEAEQARLHAAAAKCFGTISGGDPHGSEKVRETVRKRLKERYGR